MLILKTGFDGCKQGRVVLLRILAKQVVHVRETTHMHTLHPEEAFTALRSHSELFVRWETQKEQFPA